MFGFMDEQKGNNSSRESLTARDMNIPDGSRSRDESPFVTFPTRRWLALPVSLSSSSQFLPGLTITRVIAKNSRELASCRTNRSIPATRSIGPLEDESRYYGQRRSARSKGGSSAASHTGISDPFAEFLLSRYIRSSCYPATARDAMGNERPFRQDYYDQRTVTRRSPSSISSLVSLFHGNEPVRRPAAA